MSVKDLTILGSSSQQPTRRRNQVSALFRWNGEGLLFDVGEGTQRQFIFADTSPTFVTRIFISHFHGDHCLGLGSMLMRLNLDKVPHPIHCYYPASGKKYFDRLRYGTIYHETIQVVEHPIRESGIVEEGNFRIEAAYLNHGIETLAYRVTEPDRIKFDAEKLKQKGVVGPLVRELEAKKSLVINGNSVRLEEVSHVQKGDAICVISDTLPCPAAIEIARNAKILLCESTYLEEHKDLAYEHRHMTAKQAAKIAQEAGVEKLILTHFSARYLDTMEFEKEARMVFPNTFAAEDFNVFSFR